MIFLWLDESDRHGEFYSNFYGGILVSSKHYREVIERMRSVVIEENINDEIKWQKVNEYHYEKYLRVVDVLFDLAKEDKLKIRIFFRHNQFVASALTPQEKKADYQKLYYQFIKNAFGLPYADEELGSVTLYIDEIPLRQNARDEFLSHIRSLANDTVLKRKGLKIADDGIVEVNSKHHLPLQFMDVILGAICFKLNEKDKFPNITPGIRHVPKRQKLRSSIIYSARTQKNRVRHLRQLRPKAGGARVTGRRRAPAPSSAKPRCIEPPCDREPTARGRASSRSPMSSLHNAAYSVF